jgi:hypothetical protein
VSRKRNLTKSALRPATTYRWLGALYLLPAVALLFTAGVGLHLVDRARV